MVVADEVKPTSAEAITRFRELGLTPVLLTGDNEATARTVAGRGRHRRRPVIADVLPADKVDVVKRLQDEGKVVAMVGDGVNDAAALAQADLGLAMGTGTDVAIEAGDLTLVRGDLRVAADAIRLSRRTLATIKGNLFWAFAYNVAAHPAGRRRAAQPDAGRRRDGVLVGVRGDQQPAAARVPGQRSDDAVGQHRVGDLLEAGDVGALDVVDVVVADPAVLDAAGVDALHDVEEQLLELVLLPRRGARSSGSSRGRRRRRRRRWRPCRARRGSAAVLKAWTPSRSVGMLAPSLTADAAVVDQRLGVVAVQLVLGRARQRHVAGHAPRGLALVERRARERVDVLRDPAAALGLVVLDPLELLRVDAVGVVHEALAVGERDARCRRAGSPSPRRAWRRCPSPEITAVLPVRPSPRVASMLARK